MHNNGSRVTLFSTLWHVTGGFWNPPRISKTTDPIIKKNRMQLKINISLSKMQFQVNRFCRNEGISNFRKRMNECRCLPDSAFKNIFRTKNLRGISNGSFPDRFFRSKCSLSKFIHFIPKGKAVFVMIFFAIRGSAPPRYT